MKSHPFNVDFVDHFQQKAANVDRAKAIRAVVRSLKSYPLPLESSTQSQWLNGVGKTFSSDFELVLQRKRARVEDNGIYICEHETGEKGHAVSLSDPRTLKEQEDVNRWQKKVQRKIIKLMRNDPLTYMGDNFLETVAQKIRRGEIKIPEPSLAGNSKTKRKLKKTCSVASAISSQASSHFESTDDVSDSQGHLPENEFDAEGDCQSNQLEVCHVRSVGINSAISEDPYNIEIVNTAHMGEGRSDRVVAASVCSLPSWEVQRNSCKPSYDIALDIEQANSRSAVPSSKRRKLSNADPVRDTDNALAKPGTSLREESLKGTSCRLVSQFTNPIRPTITPAPADSIRSSSLNIVKTSSLSHNVQLSVARSSSHCHVPAGNTDERPSENRWIQNISARNCEITSSNLAALNTNDLRDFLLSKGTFRSHTCSTFRDAGESAQPTCPVMVQEESSVKCAQNLPSQNLPNIDEKLHMPHHGYQVGSSLILRQSTNSDSSLRGSNVGDGARTSYDSLESVRSRSACLRIAPHTRTSLGTSSSASNILSHIIPDHGGYNAIPSVDDIAPNIAPRPSYTYPLSAANSTLKLLYDTREERAFARTGLRNIAEQRALPAGDMCWVWEHEDENLTNDVVVSTRDKKKLERHHTDKKYHSERMAGYLLERKSVPDLSVSIMDGRYAEQKYRLMRLSNLQVYYLVESSKNPFWERKKSGNSSSRFGAGQSSTSASNSNQFGGLPHTTICSALVHTQFISGIRVCKTVGTQHTQELLEAFTAEIKESQRETRQSYADFANDAKKTFNLTTRQLLGKMLRHIPGCGEDAVEQLVMNS